MVYTDAKDALKLYSYTCKPDQYYAWESRFIATKSYVQGALMKNSRGKESKTRT